MMNMIYLTLDLDGRGITQVTFDLLEAVNRGNIRLYNRGGENADRPYDALIIVSKSGNILSLRGQGVWTGAPVIYRVVGYTL
ncbi:small distal tail fiber subunit (plasmid) [Aeromonas salmonicida]|nr:small distal tail fiber subunit [Aeromonas salmonicida]